LKKAIVLALALTLVSAAALFAHDAWVAKEGDVLVVKYGHENKIDPYKPEYVTAAKAYDASGKEMAVTIKPQKTRALLAPSRPPALVTATFNSGSWVKTPEGWKNISKVEAKKEGKVVLESDTSVKYSKDLWQWSDRFSKPLGGKMELVPLKNPLSLKVGDKLPVQLLYQGKPLAGAVVRAEGHGKDEIKTDANGRAEIVIKKKGFNILGVTHRTPTPHNPNADVLVEVANFSFEVT
jgi:nickel transport protein